MSFSASSRSSFQSAEGSLFSERKWGYAQKWSSWAGEMIRSIEEKVLHAAGCTTGLKKMGRDGGNQRVIVAFSRCPPQNGDTVCGPLRTLAMLFSLMPSPSKMPRYQCCLSCAERSVAAAKALDTV